MHACSIALPYATLCDAMDCSLPGSSIHGIIPARILEWVANSYSRGSSWPRDWTCVSWGSCIAGSFFTTEPPEEPSGIIFLKNNKNEKHIEANSIIPGFLVWIENIIYFLEKLCPTLQSPGQEAKEMDIYSLHELRQDSQSQGFLVLSLQKESALFTRMFYKFARSSFSESKSLLTRIIIQTTIRNCKRSAHAV